MKARDILRAIGVRRHKDHQCGLVIQGRVLWIHSLCDAHLPRSVAPISPSFGPLVPDSEVESCFDNVNRVPGRQLKVSVWGEEYVRLTGYFTIDSREAQQVGMTVAFDPDDCAAVIESDVNLT